MRRLFTVFTAGSLLIQLASGATLVDWLEISLRIDPHVVTEVDPKTGEEFTVTESSITLVVEGLRETHRYVVEESDDLKTWSEREQFFAGSEQSSLELPITPFEGGFIRLRLEDAAIPPPSGFVAIPAGSYLMGSPPEEPGRGSDELLHEVTLTRGFHMSETEVTWSDWTEVFTWAVNNGYSDLAAGRNGRNGDETGTHRVTEISWLNAIKWCNARSEKEGRKPVYYTSDEFRSENVFRIGSSEPFADWNASGYRLPTEAEWEYACRADTTTAFYSGAITQTGLSPLDPNLDAVGWYGGNSESNTHEVKSKQPNLFGLYDTHGNVREWCWDWYGPYDEASTDPKGASSGTIRVFRGGSWGESALDCRSAKRDGFSPEPATDNYGFRLVVNSKD